MVPPRSESPRMQPHDRHDLQRRRFLVSAGAVAATGAATAFAQTGDYPSKPITLVVGYPPGGSTDLTARLVGAELAKKLGQPVIIENIGGAGGALGAQKVMQAAPDGHTLLLGSNNEMAIAGLVNPALKYDPLRQFTPIGLVASQPMVLVASSRTGVTTIGQFIEQAKRNPGKFSYGSSGVGTALHLAGEMVKESAGIFVVHVHGLSDAPLRGVASLGRRPTVDDSGRVLLETHVLDWPAALGPEAGYGCLIRVELLHWLHEERRYASLDALRQGIAADTAVARAWWQQH